jgi:hypothetical protein
MTANLVNAMRIEHHEDGLTIVELPANPLRAAHLPPNFVGVAAPEVPIYRDPQPRPGELLGFDPCPRAGFRSACLSWFSFGMSQQAM